MNTKNLLIGAWQIIGAEQFDGNNWQKSEHFDKGMTWHFSPTHILPSKIIGKMAEFSPSGNDEQMLYSFDVEKNILELEIDFNNKGDYSDPQTDRYYAVFQGDDKVSLSILNEHGCPPPYFRYILRRVSKN